MGRRVVWVQLAIDDKLQILRYWDDRNKSQTYSKKLNKLFKNSAVLVGKYPYIGKKTDIPNIRIIIMKDYFIVYEIFKDKILILRIWDTRRNPDKLMQ
ncbi:MAG: type II toxin-antitoxin system RelE/ParE family toxin [Draconibacterium sp.]